ncbi:hypothetical protein [Sediminibacterium sp.]|uniref:hypothetical protein n=1 Tax=Sediminibacterium sp. TaxID=1917865 RepID=UPI0027373189|nr:hypothetical protein [Sediminibacterium sp.]MDP3395012.1 hypothetical protein [Sediminibacterium sp.]MDP3565639.1 hypothetical protein [Sediminibacterium sp.]
MEYYFIIFWIAGIVLGFTVLYLVIKSAIINGIKESGILNARSDSTKEANSTYYKPNSAQSLLKSRYERGEISFEEYIKNLMS